MLMSASSGIKIETPWISVVRSHSSSTSGFCRLLPPTPVALATGILDSSTRAVDPAVVIRYACMLV